MKKLRVVSVQLLTLVFFFIGCQQEKVNKTDELFAPPRIGTPTSSPRLISSSTGRTSAVAVQSQLFAFAGNNFYRIQSDDKTSTIIGVDWAGTEAATVMNGNLYAVQGGHLWKCNLTSTNCVDLGAAWGGTSFLTNDGSFIYGTQGGRIWKVNTNGGWAQLGIGDWGGSTEMGYSHGGGTNWPATPAGLYVRQGGRLWNVNTQNGNWIDFGISSLSPYTIPNPRPSGNNVSYGILNGRLVESIITVNSTTNAVVTPNQDWYTASDVSWTQFKNPTLNSNNIWVLRDSQIHHFRVAGGFTWPYTYQGVVPSLSGVYKIVSQQGL